MLIFPMVMKDIVPVEISRAPIMANTAHSGLSRSNMVTRKPTVATAGTLQSMMKRARKVIWIPTTTMWKGVRNSRTRARKAGRGTPKGSAR